jgi:hypothetical protein
MEEKSIWDGITSSLKKIAPIAANVFLPGSGGLVSSLISSVFGVDGDDPQAVEQAISNATPEQKIAFKEKVMEHETELLQIAAKREMAETELRYKDIADARNREKEVTRITGKRSIFLPMLAVVYVVGFFAVVFFLLTKDIPPGNADLINVLFGILVSSFIAVNHYFFGSSKGSSDKTKMMAIKQ